jgi:gas vesicle protein
LTWKNFVPEPPLSALESICGEASPHKGGIYECSKRMKRHFLAPDVAKWKMLADSVMSSFQMVCLSTLLTTNDTSVFGDPMWEDEKDKALKTLEDAKKRHLEVLKKLKTEGASKIKEVDDEANQKIEAARKDQRDIEKKLDKVKGF